MTSGHKVSGVESNGEKHKMLKIIFQVDIPIGVANKNFQLPTLCLNKLTLKRQHTKLLPIVTCFNNNLVRIPFPSFHPPTSLPYAPPQPLVS